MLGIIMLILFGVAFGGVLMYLFLYEKPIGTLVVDMSDPDDGPYTFLEVPPEHGPEFIKQRKKVTLKVEIKNYISQK